MELKENPKAHTSVNLKMAYARLLAKKSKELNISVNDLMLLLLRVAIKRKTRFTPKSYEMLVQYQEKTLDYKIVNFYLSQQDYEVFITARRFYKYSVSWLLAYAIENFLEEVFSKISESLLAGIKILNNYINNHIYQAKKHRKNYRFRSIILPYT